MAIEQKRGCGYRKVGGLYLVSGAPGIACHRLPLQLHVCPACSAGVKFSRGFTWITPRALFGECKLDREENHTCHAHNCKVCFPPEGKHGLMWVGEKFYTPEAFIEESNRMGISKRIEQLPKDFVLGETVIYLAHVKGADSEVLDQDAGPGEQKALVNYKKVPAVFMSFKPERIEKIITERESKDLKLMENLKKKGITPVVVPNNDKDHQGSVHDRKQQEPSIGKKVGGFLDRMVKRVKGNAA